MQTNVTLQNDAMISQYSLMAEDKLANVKADVERFEKILNQNLTLASSKNTATQEANTQADISQFLSDLHDKGAIQYFTDLNQEKIDAKIEEYRQKLEDKMGKDPESAQKIETLVDQYKQQMIEDLKEQMRAKQQEGGEKTLTPFEILLQA